MKCRILTVIIKSISKKPYFNREKPKKEVSIKRRTYNIVDVASRVNHQVLYTRATSILKVRSNVKIDDEIRFILECAMRVT